MQVVFQTRICLSSNGLSRTVFHPVSGFRRCHYCLDVSAASETPPTGPAGAENKAGGREDRAWCDAHCRNSENISDYNQMCPGFFFF